MTRRRLLALLAAMVPLPWFLRGFGQEPIGAEAYRWVGGAASMKPQMIRWSEPGDAAGLTFTEVIDDDIEWIYRDFETSIPETTLQFSIYEKPELDIPQSIA